MAADRHRVVPRGFAIRGGGHCRTRSPTNVCNERVPRQDERTDAGGDRARQICDRRHISYAGISPHVQPKPRTGKGFRARGHYLPSLPRRLFGPCRVRHRARCVAPLACRRWPPPGQPAARANSGQTHRRRCRRLAQWTACQCVTEQSIANPVNRILHSFLAVVLIVLRRGWYDDH